MDIPNGHSRNGATTPANTEEAMEEKFKTEWLDLSKSVIDEKETKILARALESNQLKKLKVLFLQGNAGDLGMRTMLNALHAGHLKGLQKCILWEISSYDQITTAEEGTDTIADALEEGKMPNLHTLDMTGSLPKVIPPRTVSTAVLDLLKCTCGKGRLLGGFEMCVGCICCHKRTRRGHSLDCLRFQFCSLNVYSGDDGIRKIGRALRKRPIKELRFLNLQENYIRDKGALELAKILRKGVLPHLEELDLQNNPVGAAGAKEIVLAFLQNPLLTVKVKLDWPSPLLKERAIAFRENNIRLEHRLAELGIVPRGVVINNDNYKYPGYFLKRPKTDGWLRKLARRRKNHRLHLLCQANVETYGHGARFEDHEVVGEKLMPEGIEIRRRPWFGTSSQNFVDRDLELIASSSDSDDEEENDNVDDDPVDEEKDTVGRHLSAEFSSAEDLQLYRQETSLKRQRGVNRIYITSSSLGFIGAAKALGKPTGQESVGRTVYSYVRKYFQHSTKTKQHMNTIKEELLMLAERKPDEFFYIFGLRQVLLKNPHRNKRFSRVWICDQCYKAYGESAVPITTDAQLVSRNRGQPKGDTFIGDT